MGDGGRLAGLVDAHVQARDVVRPGARGQRARGFRAARCGAGPRGPAGPRRPSRLWSRRSWRGPAARWWPEQHAGDGRAGQRECHRQRPPHQAPASWRHPRPRTAAPGCRAAEPRRAAPRQARPPPLLPAGPGQRASSPGPTRGLSRRRRAWLAIAASHGPRRNGRPGRRLAGLCSPLPDIRATAGNDHH